MEFKDSFLIIISLFYNLRQTSTIDVTLYDSTDTHSISWTADPPKGTRPGWKEASYVDSDGSVRRVFTVCNVDVADTTNWIRSPTFSKEDISRVYVSVSFTMRKCLPFPDPQSLQQCKEVFRLYFRESNEKNFDSSSDAFSDFKFLDVIAATNLYVNRTSTIPINNQSRSVPLNLTFFQFAFLDQGSCTTLLSIKIFWKACPRIDSTTLLASFPLTPTGSTAAAIVKVEGSCVAHAQPSRLLPTMLCTADAAWYPFQGACHCSPGYILADSKDSCTPCPMGTFAPNVNTSTCLSCPTNSNTLQSGSSFCECNQGYTRNPTDDLNGSCTASMNVVRELKVETMNSSSCTLNWLPPISKVDDKRYVYATICSLCSSSVSYIPSNTFINFTRITMIGLQPAQTYTVSVVAYSPEDANWMKGPFINITFTTLNQITSSAPTTTSNAWLTKLEVRRVGDVAYLTWSSTLNFSLYEILIAQTLADSTQTFSSSFSSNNYTSISHLQQNSQYTFKIRGKYNETWTDYSSPVVLFVEKNILEPQTTEFGSERIGLIVGILLGLIVAIVFIVIFCYCFVARRRKQANSCATSSSDCDILKYVIANPVCIESKDQNLTNRSSDSLHIYADPTTFDDILFSNSQINYNQITSEITFLKTWCSEFAHGLVVKQGGGIAKSVLLDRLLVEARYNDDMLLQLQHVNIARVEAFINSPSIIVHEPMYNAGLVQYLQNNEEKLVEDDLLVMMRQVASALNYLASKHLIHRNLSSDSIFVDGRKSCKVASLNFIINNQKVKSEFPPLSVSQGMIRWSAPEVMLSSCWSSASDTWSLGVVMWHMVTRASEAPYEGWNDNEVLNAAASGLVLSKPQNCSNGLYRMMLECWRLDAASRPSLLSIIDALQGHQKHQPRSQLHSSFTRDDSSINTRGSKRAQSQSGSSFLV